ncbi:MAG: type II toxin-antitoxin system RelE/ParE family toxin [Sedimenticola sp.]
MTGKRGARPLDPNLCRDDRDIKLKLMALSEVLVKKTIGLDQLPRKGRMVPELCEDAVRELGLYSYRILYEIKSNDLIEVLAVIHKRQHVEVEDIPRDQQNNHDTHQTTS